MKFRKLITLLVTFFPYFVSAQSEYSNKLFEKGVQLYKDNKYQQAAKIFAECDSLDRAQMDSLDQRAGYARMWEACCLWALGDTVSAINKSPYCFFEPIDRRKTCVSDSLANAGIAKSNIGDIEGAVEDYIRCSEIEKTTLGDNNIWYINSLTNIGGSYMSMGDFSEAEKWIEEAQKKTSNVWGAQSDRNLNLLYFLGICYLKQNKENDYNQIKKTFSQNCEEWVEINYNSYANNALCLFRLIKESNDTIQLIDELDKFYDVNNNILSQLSSKGMHDNCISLINFESTIVSELIGKNNDLYLRILECLEYEYEQVEDFNKATETSLEALTILEEYDLTHTESYYDFVEKSAYSLHNLGQNNTSIQLYEEILPDLIGTNREQSIMYNLANRYYDIENYAEALYYADKVDSICKENGNCNSSIYVKTLLMKSWFYTKLDKPTESEKNARDAFKLINTLELDFNERIDALDRYITICIETDNRAEEIVACKEALRITENRDSEKYIEFLNKLASAYNNIWENSLAVKCSEKCVELQRGISGETNAKYAEYLYYLAANYMGNDQYEKAFNTLLMYERIKDDLGEPYSKNQLYNSLGICIGSLGDHEKAIEYMHKSIDECKSHQLGYALVLSNIAVEYAQLDMYDKAIEYISQVPRDVLLAIDGGQLRNYYELLYIANDSLFNENFLLYNEYALKKINNTYLTLNTQERLSFYRMFEDHFEVNCPKYAYETNDSNLIANAYQAALLCKGIHLNSEIETRKIVQESNDSSIIYLYEKLINQKKQLTKLYERSQLDFFEIDSLSQIIQSNEEELCYKSKEYKSYINDINTNWKQIKNNLKENEIAIEFVSYKDNDVVRYFALTLKSEYRTPCLTYLFNEEQLNTNLNKDIYNDEKIYDLIWAPLEKQLKDVDNVYFSPTGKLHNINLECLPEIYKDDDRNYWRLSSTRQLINENQIFCSSGASVYGGLRYDSSLQSIKNDSKQYNYLTRSCDEALLNFENALDRGSLKWHYLPGTLVEAEAVNKTMQSSNVQVYLLTDSIGTEASFKALDGVKRKYIHIATHGFYYAEHDSTKMYRAGLELYHIGENRKKQYIEDKSLTRSGLLLTGCNNKLVGINIPDGTEDGILFAKEIAYIDLRGLELVTLSACESGLGDISSEGVFGLQRAFKKAGAHSILMSLWKVDDNATCILMTQFYNNLLSKKMSKAESLKEAQRYVRTFENGRYKDPKYWAAFIILDAI